MSVQVRVAVDEAFDLGEGPVWDPIRQQVLWVDIRTGRVLTGVLRSDGAIDVLEQTRFPGTVGAVAVSAAGEWLVAGTDRLRYRSADGSRVSSLKLLPPDSGRRLNDGKPDPAGRFVVGTLSLDAPSRTETLVVVDSDGSVMMLDGDLTLSNGLAWTPDGATLYSVDTIDGAVYRREYDVATGTAGPRSLLLAVTDGSPDGMCLDAEGHLWIAIWGGGQVRRFAPDGRFVSAIDVPAPNVSCVTFAGPDLDTLVITTATQDMTQEELAESPSSGFVFTAVPGVRGFPSPLWDGRTPETASTEGTA